jgi:hypothetical protein
METMETNHLRELALVYEARRTDAEELKAQLADANKAKDEAESALINAILSVAEQTGIDDLSVNVEGRKYSVRVKDYYSIPKDNRDEAFAILRDLGLGDLITERVDDRTLTSTLAEKREEYREENPGTNEDFPAEYEPLLAVMSTYSKPTLGRVKAK